MKTVSQSIDNDNLEEICEWITNKIKSKNIITNKLGFYIGIIRLFRIIKAENLKNIYF
jgi:hypothetical protein